MMPSLDSPGTPSPFFGILAPLGIPSQGAREWPQPVPMLEQVSEAGSSKAQHFQGSFAPRKHSPCYTGCGGGSGRALPQPHAAPGGAPATSATEPGPEQSRHSPRRAAVPCAAAGGARWALLRASTGPPTLNITTAPGHGARPRWEQEARDRERVTARASSPCPTCGHPTGAGVWGRCSLVQLGWAAHGGAWGAAWGARRDAGAGL